MDSLIIFIAKYLIVFVGLLFIWLWAKAKPSKKKTLLIHLIIAGLTAAVLTKLAGKLYFHPRPFVTQNIKPLVAHGADNGFPSEHTVLAMTITAILYFYNRQLALAALVLTILMGVGRVLAHVHSPIDILAGLIVGTLAGWAGWKITQRYWPAHKSHKPVEKNL